MKKIKLLLMVMMSFIMLVGVVGCSKDDYEFDNYDFMAEKDKIDSQILIDMATTASFIDQNKDKDLAKDLINTMVEAHTNIDTNSYNKHELQLYQRVSEQYILYTKYKNAKNEDEKQKYLSMYNDAVKSIKSILGIDWDEESVK